MEAEQAISIIEMEVVGQERVVQFNSRVGVGRVYLPHHFAIEQVVVRFVVCDIFPITARHAVNNRTGVAAIRYTRSRFVVGSVDCRKYIGTSTDNAFNITAIHRPWNVPLHILVWVPTEQYAVGVILVDSAFTTEGKRQFYPSLRCNDLLRGVGYDLGDRVVTVRCFDHLTSDTARTGSHQCRVH
ncbi:hypothetical protein D9M70_393390 [compost metagenome]